MGFCELDCRNSGVCFGLRPRTISGKKPPVSVECCHYTCRDVGMRAARGAREAGGGDEYSVKLTPDSEVEEITAVSFSTSQKPFNRRMGRIVDPEGEIFSLGDDGIYYPTGQRVE